MTRAAHPTDRRATLVSLTPKGAQVAAAMRRDQDGFAQLLFRDVSAKELDAFVTMLDHILGRIGELMLPATGTAPGAG